MPVGDRPETITAFSHGSDLLLAHTYCSGGPCTPSTRTSSISGTSVSIRRPCPPDPSSTVVPRILLALTPRPPTALTFSVGASIAPADHLMTLGDKIVFGVLIVVSSWLRLLPWALTTAVVSYLLRAMRGGGQRIVRRLTGVTGMAWRVVSFFVLPKLVFEDRSFVETVRDSGRSFKETWGENAAGNLGLTLLKIVLVIPTGFIFGFAFRLSGVGVVIGVAVAALWLLAALTIVAALTGVYQTALYQYMCERRTPKAFADTDLSTALSA